MISHDTSSLDDDRLENLSKLLKITNNSFPFRKLASRSFNLESDGMTAF